MEAGPFRSSERAKVNIGEAEQPREGERQPTPNCLRFEANRSERFALPVPLLLRGVWQAAERGAGRCLELCTLTAEKSAVEGRPEKCLRWPQALFLDPLPAFDAAVRQFIALRVAAL